MDLHSALNVVKERINEGEAAAFFILTLALIVGPRLAEKVRLPAMVGLVLVGMVVGPHGFHLLDDKGIALSAWGNFGLLYLMFSAGLELDLKLLARMKKAAITFALLSFAFPFVFGVTSAKVLGYAWAGAILMGSNWGSHTLVTYPILQKMGLSQNKAVATVVGATAITDTTALLVLTGVTATAGAAASSGGGGLGIQAVEIIVGLAVLVGWSLFVLPRVGLWFFGRVGSDRSYRLVFGTVALLAGAVVAQMVQIDGIVGAFFAGLGLGRVIPEKSPLMERVQYFGTTLFIPIFLVSVGVLLQPKVLIDPKTLGIAAVFTVAVLGGKALAAVVAGRVFHFAWPEIGVMSGLSGSQAAATLATTLIGSKLKIFNEQTVNAVLVVILITLVATPAMVTYFSKKMPRDTAAGEALGGAVLVPVWGESPVPQLGMAAQLAAPDCGMVVPAAVVTEDASGKELDSQRSLLKEAQEWLAKQGLEARGVLSVSRSLEAGLFQTMRAEHATLLVAGWGDPEQARLTAGERETFDLVNRSPVPMLLTHGEVESFDRVLLVAREKDLTRTGREDLELAAELTTRLADGGHGHGHGVAYVGTEGSAATELFAPKQRVDHTESPDPIAWVEANARDDDLLVFPGLAAAKEALKRLPGLLHKRFVVAIAAHEFRHHATGAVG
jgi:Kef-type K+ transport system membrane component KefB